MVEEEYLRTNAAFQRRAKSSNIHLHPKIVTPFPVIKKKDKPKMHRNNDLKMGMEFSH